MLAVKHKIVTNLPIIEVEENMILFEKGEEDFTTYLLIDGAVKTYVHRGKGEDEIEHDIAIIKKHEFFGESEMFNRTPRNVCARTTAPSKLVVIKTEAEFEQFITENRWLSGHMMETMSDKLAETNRALVARRQAADTSTNVILEVDKSSEHGEGGVTRRIIRH